MRIHRPGIVRITAKARKAAGKNECGCCLKTAAYKSAETGRQQQRKRHTFDVLLIN